MSRMTSLATSGWLQSCNVLYLYAWVQHKRAQNSSRHLSGRNVLKFILFWTHCHSFVNELRSGTGGSWTHNRRGKRTRPVLRLDTKGTAFSQSSHSMGPVDHSLSWNYGKKVADRAQVCSDRSWKSKFGFQISIIMCLRVFVSRIAPPTITSEHLGVAFHQIPPTGWRSCMLLTGPKCSKNSRHDIRYN